MSKTLLLVEKDQLALLDKMIQLGRFDVETSIVLSCSRDLGGLLKKMIDQYGEASLIDRLQEADDGKKVRAKKQFFF